MADYSILGTEINTDPLAIGYSIMDDQQAADSLNTENRLVLRLSRIGEIRNYLSTQIAGTGNSQRSTIGLLQEFADSGTMRGVVPTVTPTASLDARRSAAQMIWFMLKHGNEREGFAVKNTNIRNQFISIGPDGGNGPGVFTTQQLLDIEGLAEVTVSRSNEIGWPGPVTSDDIARVRA